MKEMSNMGWGSVNKGENAKGGDAVHFMVVYSSSPCPRGTGSSSLSRLTRKYKLQIIPSFTVGSSHASNL